MYRYILKRLLYMFPVLIGVTIIVFTLLYFSPGNPAAIILGQEATPEKIEELRTEYGYDRNVFVRFFSWLGGVFTGDLGVSIKYNPITGSELIGQRMTVTIWLGVLSIFLIVIFSIPLGLICAKKPGAPAKPGSLPGRSC